MFASPWKSGPSGPRKPSKMIVGFSPRGRPPSSSAKHQRFPVLPHEPERYVGGQRHQPTTSQPADRDGPPAQNVPAAHRHTPEPKSKRHLKITRTTRKSP